VSSFSSQRQCEFSDFHLCGSPSCPTFRGCYSFGNVFSCSSAKIDVSLSLSDFVFLSQQEYLVCLQKGDLGDLIIALTLTVNFGSLKTKDLERYLFKLI
jgi:hypothetical protein